MGDWWAAEGSLALMPAWQMAFMRSQWDIGYDVNSGAQAVTGASCSPAHSVMRPVPLQLPPVHCGDCGVHLMMQYTLPPATYFAVQMESKLEQVPHHQCRPAGVAARPGVSASHHTPPLLHTRQGSRPARLQASQHVQGLPLCGW